MNAELSDNVMMKDTRVRSGVFLEYLSISDSKGHNTDIKQQLTWQPHDKLYRSKSLEQTGQSLLPPTLLLF